MSQGILEVACVAGGLGAIAVSLQWMTTRFGQAARLARTTARLPDGWRAWFFSGFAHATVGAGVTAAVWLAMLGMAVGLGLIGIGLHLFE